jgi:hypothetical protein
MDYSTVIELPSLAFGTLCPNNQGLKERFSSIQLDLRSKITLSSYRRRWIKLLLSDAGVDTTIYSAHFTRGASASKAVSVGLSIESILQTGGWSSENIIATHYTARSIKRSWVTLFSPHDVTETNE